jgi:Fe-S-cluster containining protein
MENNPPQFVPSEKCLACEGCCRFGCADSQWRPKADEKGEMYVDCLDESEYLKVEIVDGICKCLFLDQKTNKCEIYKDRPFECRLYPFLIGNEEGRIAVYLHLSCPHVQDVMAEGALDKNIEQIKNYFDLAETKDFLKAKRQLAGDYASFQSEMKKLFEVDL